MAGKSQRQNQVPHNAPKIDTGDMDFWRGIVIDLAPKGVKQDANHVEELATILQQFAQKTIAHFPKASSICDMTENKTCKIVLDAKLCRMNTPGEITTGIKYGQSFGERTTVRVSDPTQKELPLSTKQAGKDDENAEE